MSYPDWIEINNLNNWLYYEIGEVLCTYLESKVFPREMFVM